MSTSRVSVCGASLVCSVDSTRWPVCAALMRDLGRLEVADFADHDHVRVLAQERAQRRGERQADLRVDVDLVDARHVDFRRVLGGRDVAVFGVEDVEARCTATRSCRCRSGRSPGSCRRASPAYFEVELLLERPRSRARRCRAARCDGSRIRSTTFSPNSVGQVLTRKSMARFFDSRILMRPSCGTRRSAMSSRDMTFRRAATFVASCTGGTRDLLQHAVQARSGCGKSFRRARNGCPTRPS